MAAKLRNDNGYLNDTNWAILKTYLQELAAESGGMSQIYSKLPPREAEICRMVKNRTTSKKIATSLNISEVTMSEHREHIRKKLIISKHHIN